MVRYFKNPTRQFLNRFADGTGKPYTIKRIGGREETKKFLENLGFVTGGVVTVVSEISGNMILNVKDSRVALGKDMANKIMI